MAGGGSNGRQPRIDLVPIIDAMTCVIFFMLLSSTFVEFTKITLPPSVSKVTEAKLADKDPPISPKLIGLDKGENIEFVLSWTGNNPDRIVSKVKRDPDNKRSSLIQNKIQEMLKQFSLKYPQEKTLLVGFSPKIKYQEVISTLDGARVLPQIDEAPKKPNQIMDIVMLSWTEAQLLQTGSVD